MSNDSPKKSEGIASILDTDLYKLTMQNAVLKYFPDIDVSYSFTNRTSHLKLNREAYDWLKGQVSRFADIYLTEEESIYLTKTCPYFTSEYLSYLRNFRFYPDKQIKLDFRAEGGDTHGDLNLEIRGKWIDTILYEVPLLSLISEAYFKFSDTDWTYDGQEEKAYEKGISLTENGCNFSEFGTRRRRDLHAQELVIKGLNAANTKAKAGKYPGAMLGTSNVYLAKKFQIPPIGTVAHEWFMGVAAITNDYINANENAMRYWMGTYGKGTLSIMLTDTFGTPAFLKAFSKAAKLPSEAGQETDSNQESYAKVFTGVRQDSGDPAVFVQSVKEFYDKQGVKSNDKLIVFSDSLNLGRCREYKALADKYELKCSFGIGTFLTNDFMHAKQSKEKSLPLNIVIKLSSAESRPAVKISDNHGKNTGDSEQVAKVKRDLGYIERDWSGGNEARRWDK